MASSIITPEDLQRFKIELLEEIHKLLSKKHPQPVHKWLKSAEVRKLLGISPGTLQNFRVSGVLPFTKIGGVIFYDYQDIERMLELHKRDFRRSTR